MDRPDTLTSSRSTIPRLKLITIRFSHFCEKARWALDRYRVPYEEEGHLPLFHARAVKRHARGEQDRASSSLSTPLLLVEGRAPLTDSADIVRFASDAFGGGELYPNDEVRALERAFHDKLGVHARRAAYAFLLNDKASFFKLCETNVPGRESTLVKLAFPLMSGRLKKRLKADRQNLERSSAIIDGCLDDLEARLGDRAFLVGERFSAADLAFACALAPAIVVSSAEGYGAPLPELGEVPAPFRVFAERLRARPAAKFALRLFREERGERALAYGAPLDH